jgi:late competence protein required for DNA uptake (superfamily II DNA/RNA helicase)
MAAVAGGAEVAARLAMMTLKTYCGAVRISSGRLCRVANKSQSQREHALAAVRATRIRVLVATDIAARGIDIEQVTHVVNYELLECWSAMCTKSGAPHAPALQARPR